MAKFREFFKEFSQLLIFLEKRGSASRFGFIGGFELVGFYDAGGGTFKVLNAVFRRVLKDNMLQFVVMSFLLNN